MDLRRLGELLQRVWRSPALWFFIGVLNLLVMFVGFYLGDDSLTAVGAISLVSCWFTAAWRRWGAS